MHVLRPRDSLKQAIAGHIAKHRASESEIWTTLSASIDHESSRQQHTAQQSSINPLRRSNTIITGMEYAEYPRDSPDRAPVRDGRDDYRANDSYRERRRSPVTDRRVDDRDRTRRRSRSPGVDRYAPSRVPRDDYYSRRDQEPRRDRRRSSPGDRGAPPTIDRYVPSQAPNPLSLVNPIVDPMLLEIQAGYTYFAEHWRQEKRIKEEREFAKSGRRPAIKGDREMRSDRDAEKAVIQAAYDEYKVNLQKKHAQQFVRAHKHENWFRERYVGEVREPFRAKLMGYRRELYDLWVNDLNEGVFDNFNLEGIYKSESNGAGGVLEKEEGEATAATEVLGVGDLDAALGGDIRDPIASLPTLLIKTLGPSVGRVQLEDLAKEHLGEGEGGFKHLSLADPNPLKKCFRMGWMIINPETTKTDTMATPEADSSEAVEAPKGSVGERALEKINGKVIEDGSDRGGFTVHFALHRPPTEPRKKALWDLFSTPERIVRDAELATRLVRQLDNELGDNYFGVAKVLQRVEQLIESGQLKAPSPPSQDNADEDMDVAEENGEIIEEQEPASDLSTSIEFIQTKKNLDLLVEYLRRVHNFCFFCVFESDSVHELQRKCPGGHLRRPRSSLTSTAVEVGRASAAGQDFPLRSDRGNGRPVSPNEDGEAEFGSPVMEHKMTVLPRETVGQFQRAYKWVKTFEDKILQLLEPGNVDIVKLGGTSLEDGVDDELKKWVKLEDSNRIRCKVPECTKLFKGMEFWRKHVEKRHEEFYDRVIKDVQLVNTYVLDPAHIAPGRSDANSNGHYPIGQNGQLTGTPRGFNLSQHMMGAGIPGFNPGMTLPTGWGPPGSATNPIMGMMGATGPIRTGGMRNNNYRNPGPYARNDGRARQPSFTGIRDQRTLIEHGVIGPIAATTGRSMRSYEDLDAAVPTNASAELDY
nr:hypothetical protein B0A51_01567 [Rachicladosporium sp. CCFEE 5018]